MKSKTIVKWTLLVSIIKERKEEEEEQSEEFLCLFLYLYDDACDVSVEECWERKRHEGQRQSQLAKWKKKGQ